ncbi:MAG TPA: di-heme-cytochrome C peroxidase [Bryobacteraceae bacterium]|nr:di-heme-cytochrome C peroxidase [Bryobacteraceae bacterium]
MMPDDPAPVAFERKPPTEDRDILEIIRAVLTIQARTSRQQKKPLARGTHAKGSAVRGEFEILDVTADGRPPALAKRLAVGIFARPGKYPATVRFANAVSAPSSDEKPDVRAMSFSIQVPEGALACGATRLDFSLNGATTFPMNDARAFAAFIRVMAAAGVWGKLKTLWRRSLADAYGFLKVAVLGGAQQLREPKLAYQQLRYWSTVPFAHGAGEAVKYSATPSPLNPSQFQRNGPNCLQDELARHVNQDQRMSEWDFGIQLLDAGRMKRHWRHRDAAFWIENATVEWNEDQAPFHTVARLRLLPQSTLTPEETAAQHIDVNENATPDTRPLGGINRARWPVERASRTAREGGVVDMPAAQPFRRPLWAKLLRWGLTAFAAVAAAWQIAGVFYGWAENRNVPRLQRADNVRYLDQGWGTDPEAASRQTYYYTPQGASLSGVRYSWFVNLERAFSTQRLADPDHMRRLNFIVDRSPSRANPDLLPVGFARYYDATRRDDMLDITCAACHTGQLNVTRPAPAGSRNITTAIRVDGGQALTAFTDVEPGSFTVELIGGIGVTLADPFKFNRFANRVIGPQASVSDKARLWGQVACVFGRFLSLGVSGSFKSGLYPTQEGYGRTDAIGRISNVVFGDHVDPRNYRNATGPASYPPVWNVWKFDWEQYSAFVAQPMARNIGEGMGTGADYQLVDSYGRPMPPSERYDTSFAFEGVHRIESTLQTLQAPAWPQDLLDDVKLPLAKRGRQIFLQRCIMCHGPRVASRSLTLDVAPGRVPDDPKKPALPMWLIRYKPLAQIGTDPQSTQNLVGFRLDMTRAGLDLTAVQAMLRGEIQQQESRDAKLLPNLQQESQQVTAARNSAPANSPARAAAEAALSEINQEMSDAQGAVSGDEQQIKDLAKLDLHAVTIGEGLSMLGMIMRDRYYDEHHYPEAARECYNGFGMLDLPQAELGYKPRPLEGVWATPPFLHNGSVPTVYDLLSPVDDRPKTFYLGRREYDPKLLGYATPLGGDESARLAARGAIEKPPAPAAGEFLYNTELPGNSNHGHQFNTGYVEWDPAKPPEANYQNGLIGPKLSEQDKLAVIEYLKIHRDDLDAVDYMEKHNGAYPPPSQYSLPDCSATLPKKP